MTRGLQAATSTKDRLAPLVEALQMGGSSLGLAFSQLSPTDFQKALSNSTSTHDYARKGTMAPETVTLPDGPLMRNEELLPHTMERELRQLGLSVVMKKGQVSLEEPFTICEKDQPLTMQQADALRAFFIQFPLFSISLVAQTKL